LPNKQICSVVRFVIDWRDDARSHKWYQQKYISLFGKREMRLVAPRAGCDRGYTENTYKKILQPCNRRAPSAAAHI
jgi:hypothetical protein